MKTNYTYRLSEDTFLKKEGPDSLYVFNLTDDSHILKIKGPVIKACYLLERGTNMTVLKQELGVACQDDPDSLESNLLILLELLKKKGYLEEVQSSL